MHKTPSQDYITLLDIKEVITLWQDRAITDIQAINNITSILAERKSTIRQEK